MTRETLDAIKLRKNFYRNNYYRVLQALYVCLFLVVILVMALFYEVITWPETKFYATNSVGFVDPLPALSGANNSAAYLLKPDQPRIDPKKPLKITFAGAKKQAAPSAQ